MASSVGGSLDEIRAERKFPEEPDTSTGRRTAFARDRDRILHSSALRRLAAVTQVVDPSEGHIFHNRLTHTLKVAQIGRRLAEKLLQEQPAFVELVGGIDPEVVEAAALAHDLGHPPFGHVAEKKLDELLTSGAAGEASRVPQVPDGYEGNAQSLRIVTKLAVRSDDHAGLNLTRATLNALLKYPWFRGPSGAHRKKWGAYHHTEEHELRFARAHEADGPRSAEAELMDWADDVTYAVHDLEDFYRAGLVPLDRLAVYADERRRWVEAVYQRRADDPLPISQERFAEIVDRVFDTLWTREPYRGTRAHRAALRQTTSSLINHYVGAISLADPSTEPEGRRVKIDPEAVDDIRMLKELTWHFVIENPALASQQHGKERVIAELFEIYWDASSIKRWRSILPTRCREDLADGLPDELRARLVADVISSLSDQEALAVHGRLTGTKAGSLLDFLPR